MRWEIPEDHSVSTRERAVCTGGAPSGSWYRSRMVKNVGRCLGQKQSPAVSLEGQACGCEVGYVEQLRTPPGQAV